MDGKKRLSEATFDSLDAMMIAYAEEAVRAAAGQGWRLDFSDESIAAVERCLAEISVSAELDYHTRLWGAYLGEVVRRRFGGSWQMSQYPGSTLAVPALEINGSHLYPMMKVYRRLTLGEGENVTAFYGMVAGRLGPPSTIH